MRMFVAPYGTSATMLLGPHMVPFACTPSLELSALADAVQVIGEGGGSVAVPEYVKSSVHAGRTLA